VTQNIQERWETLHTKDGHTLGVFVCVPSDSPRGALLIVQEVFGVNSHIQNVARGFARDGYLTVAPRFFDRLQADVQLGYTQADVTQGLAYVQQLSWEQTCLDMRAAVALDTQLPWGVVGYCWGGTMAWRAAADITGLSAAVCYYGGGITGLAQLEPQCPVQLHWGEHDPIIALDAARAFAAAHPQTESHFYPADHGFNCDLRASYHALSAHTARQRTRAFLEKHLG